MLREIEQDMIDIEKALVEVERNCGDIIRPQAEDRFALEMARAEARDQIEHRTLSEGEKRPTVAAIDAEVDLMTRDELEKSRLSTAELEVMKVMINSLTTRLTSLQTRAKLSMSEMSLAR